MAYDIHMPVLSPTSQAGPMRNPIDGTSVCSVVQPPFLERNMYKG